MIKKASRYDPNRNRGYMYIANCTIDIQEKYHEKARLISSCLQAVLAVSIIIFFYSFRNHVVLDDKISMLGFLGIFMIPIIASVILFTSKSFKEGGIKEATPLREYSLKQKIFIKYIQYKILKKYKINISFSLVYEQASSITVGDNIYHLHKENNENREYVFYLLKRDKNLDQHECPVNKFLLQKNIKPSFDGIIKRINMIENPASAVLCAIEEESL